MKFYSHFLVPFSTRFCFEEVPKFDAKDWASISACKVETREAGEDASSECRRLAANVEYVNGLPDEMRRAFESELAPELLAKLRGNSVSEIFEPGEPKDSGEDHMFKILMATVRDDFAKAKSITAADKLAIDLAVFGSLGISGAGPLHVLVEFYPDLILFR